MYWEVDLTNGETVSEDVHDPTHWGQLLAECNQDKLEIIEFRLVTANGSKVIDKNADMYFVINDILAVLKGPTLARRGIGSVRTTVDKIRTEWYEWHTREFITVEVTRGIMKHIPDISVARHKPQ